MDTNTTMNNFEQYLTTFLVETMGVMPTPEDKKKGEEARKSKQTHQEPKPAPKPRNPKQEAMDRAKKKKKDRGWR